MLDTIKTASGTAKDAHNNQLLADFIGKKDLTKKGYELVIFIEAENENIFDGIDDKIYITLVDKTKYPI